MMPKKKISPLDDAKKSEPSSSLKQKRGCPSKNGPPKPTNHVINQFATNNIVGLVELWSWRDIQSRTPKDEPIK
jgi:hypothetical protein